ncbi:MAG: zinc metallopeptidase [Planctomycetales bacterium]|nr:zinc metallopeptidase [Planctomycetales bacterium]
MIFDIRYMLFVLIPGMIISGIASFLVRSAFNKYSKVRSRNGLTGAEAAQRLLDGAGIHDVQVVPVDGYLSDHYDPSRKLLALSPGVYSSNSVAAIGVATHEAGHAIQHARGYSPLKLRSALVPVAGFGSSAGLWVMAIGLAIGPTMVAIGAGIFALWLLFQLVTLPVEFDATARAKQLVVESGIIYPDERKGMDRVLNAAALTYVAGAITTLLTLVYYLHRAGLLGGSDD